MGNSKEIVYKGKPFPSISALAKELNIKRSTLSMTINNNPDLAIEEAVNKVLGLDKKVLITIDGVDYRTYAELSKAFGINSSTISSRITEGYSLYDAVTKPVNQVCKPLDYKGNHYDSITQLLNEYGLDLETYKNRKNLGWDLDKILAYKVGEVGTGRAEGIDFRGIHYPSKAKLASAFNVPYTDFMRKLRYGWEIDEALGLVPVDFNAPAVTTYSTSGKKLVDTGVTEEV